MADGLGVFRKRDFGDVEVDVNTKAMNQDRFIDQSRIGTHDEWRQNENPMKPGKIVQVKDSPTDNARLSCDAMKHRSSFTDESLPKRERSGYDVPCCSYGGNGPLTTRRGE